MLDLCAAPGGKTMQLAAAGHRVRRRLVGKSSRTAARESARTDLETEMVAADAPLWKPAAVRRGAARRALLGDRHLPPPSRRLYGAARGRRGRAGCRRSCSTRRGLGEAGRYARLFGLFAGARGGRGGDGLPRSARISASSAPRPEFAAACARSIGSKPPACSKPRAASTASSRRASSRRLIPSNQAHGRPIIAPSILSADFARLGEEARAIDAPAPTGSTST